MVHNPITVKLRELKEAREREEQYFGSNSNGKPRIIRSIDELRSLSRSYEIENELLELYKQQPNH